MTYNGAVVDSATDTISITPRKPYDSMFVLATLEHLLQRAEQLRTLVHVPVEQLSSTTGSVM